MPELRHYAEQLGEAQKRMPPLLLQEVPLGQVNFEQMRFVVFPLLKTLQSGFKALEVRELRVRSLGRRGSGVARMGVFAGEDIDPGTLIGEYVGHVQTLSNIIKRNSSGGPNIENVSQSFILFCAASPGLVVDSRRFGNNLRYVRRSCRANCEVKMVLTEGGGTDQAEAVHWCLFARNTIRENEELFLPIDYGEGGNHYFRYECCCPYPELCLADDIVINPLNNVERSAVASTFNLPSSSTSTNSGGFASLGMTSIGRAKRTAPDRKLSREERKLQQYIEFIERMETAERKHGRKAGSSTSVGESVGASPPALISSPKHNRKLLATFEKTTPPETQDEPPPPSGDPDGEETSRRGADPDESSTINYIESNPLRLSNSPSSSKQHHSLPLKKKLSLSFSREITTESSFKHGNVKDYQGVVTKKEKVSLENNDDYDDDNHSHMFDGNNDSRKSGGEAPPPPPQEPLDSRENLTRDVIDLVDPSTTTTTTTSNPETPSKKRVSLSDYFSRRKSSPVDRSTRSRELLLASDSGDTTTTTTSGGNFGQVQTSTVPSISIQEQTVKVHHNNSSLIINQRNRIAALDPNLAPSLVQSLSSPSGASTYCRSPQSASLTFGAPPPPRSFTPPSSRDNYKWMGRAAVNRREVDEGEGWDGRTSHHHHHPPNFNNRPSQSDRHYNQQQSFPDSPVQLTTNSRNGQDLRQELRRRSQNWGDHPHEQQATNYHHHRESSHPHHHQPTRRYPLFSDGVITNWDRDRDKDRDKDRDRDREWNNRDRDHRSDFRERRA